MLDVEKLKIKTGYKGKPQQWQYGFDLAIRELTQSSEHVLMPVEINAETTKIIYHGLDNFNAAFIDGKGTGGSSMIYAYCAMLNYVKKSNQQ